MVKENYVVIISKRHVFAEINIELVPRDHSIVEQYVLDQKGARVPCKVPQLLYYSCESVFER